MYKPCKNKVKTKIQNSGLKTDLIFEKNLKLKTKNHPEEGLKKLAQVDNRD
jgi:hypothetical protein